MQEAFVNIKEKLKNFLEMKGELINGLNLINSANLEYLPAEYKAEIFRLKGNFLLRLNDSDGANTAYSNAISLCKNLPKGWISWGHYCEMVPVFNYLLNEFMLLILIFNLCESVYPCFRLTKHNLTKFG